MTPLASSEALLKATLLEVLSGLHLAPVTQQ
jgi:hypothetical protein